MAGSAGKLHWAETPRETYRALQAADGAVSGGERERSLDALVAKRRKRVFARGSEAEKRKWAERKKKQQVRGR